MEKSRFKMAFFYVMFSVFAFFLFLFAYFLKDTSCQYLNQKCKNLLIVIAFSVLCITGFVCATVVVVKDDERIRFAKLEALKEAQKDFSSDDKAKFVEEEKTEKASGETVTVEKRTYCELMKTYMQSVTEI